MPAGQVYSYLRLSLARALSLTRAGASDARAVCVADMVGFKFYIWELLVFLVSVVGDHAYMCSVGGWRR